MYVLMDTFSTVHNNLHLFHIDVFQFALHTIQRASLNFAILNVLAKLKLSCCGYNNQKSQMFLLRAKSVDLQIVILATAMQASMDITICTNL